MKPDKKEPKIKVDLTELPPTIQVIIQLTDYKTAQIIMDKLGGLEYKFPRLSQLTEAHRLSELIGFNTAQKLCRYFDGSEVYIAKIDRYLSIIRNQTIIQELENLGATTDNMNTLAKKYGVTERWVREIRRRNQQKKPTQFIDRQLDMFV